MNVLLISPEYPPRCVGGGGVVYKNLSEQLASKGHSVKVLAGNLSNKNLVGSIESVEGKVDLNFVPLLPYPKLKKANSASYTPPTLPGLLFILKELVRNRNAVVHLHGFCHPVIDMTALACMATQKKYILTCHGIPVNPSNFSAPARVLFNLYLSTIGRLVVKKASALTTVSNSLKNECTSKNLTNKKTIVIPNGADDTLLLSKVQTVSIIERKYNLEGKKVIFALGRLSENKGFQHLVKAMHTVLTQVPTAVALIAGSGPYRTELEKLIENEGLSANVKLIGWVSEEEKAALFQRSDVVVFPSVNEPFGIVLLEALKLHKPLIAFNTESAREILHNDCALLVPVGDESELGQAVVQVIVNPLLKNKLVANSSVVDSYSWEKIATQYLNVYQSVNQSQMSECKRN